MWVGGGKIAIFEWLSIFPSFFFFKNTKECSGWGQKITFNNLPNMQSVLEHSTFHVILLSFLDYLFYQSGCFLHQLVDLYNAPARAEDREKMRRAYKAELKLEILDSDWKRILSREWALDNRVQTAHTDRERRRRRSKFEKASPENSSVSDRWQEIQAAEWRMTRKICTEINISMVDDNVIYIR